MPRGDGTGPMGTGAMTGRAAGFCAGYGMPGYANAAGGRGFGMGYGRGGGRGWRNRFAAGGWAGWPQAAAVSAWSGVAPFAVAPTREQQLDALKGQEEQFENTLNDLRKRIGELESEKSA